MKSPVRDWLYWTPRGLAILIAVYLATLALDVFQGGYSFFRLLVALGIHLIPTFIVLIVLAIAWKWELVGGILFILPPLVYTIYIGFLGNFLTGLTLSSPFFLVGALFIIHHSQEARRRRRRKNQL